MASSSKSTGRYACSVLLLVACAFNLLVSRCGASDVTSYSTTEQVQRTDLTIVQVKRNLRAYFEETERLDDEDLENRVTLSGIEKLKGLAEAIRRSANCRRGGEDLCSHTESRQEKMHRRESVPALLQV
ncbi:hypothetical protein PHYSODRAFT_286180 [Phytophthora sojae]|uniref:RxLR effector protein n=2 Tax=Phytophthora sojae TaxID=67593 RepID=G4ZLL6_PHYSP|nr:hypothetical protein PHYSODRAFT_286180 [Phytophthora sojae]AEK81197.1 Avh337 [Phytophthora sojae]AEK81198.1 Avh337 [Phytophthora sojae]EGZ14591.1 hypothetical protein PHYSODRAFT_286180 [Phytophthora sojae]|eukprot:XP_009528340.1 hypothetical protein PHYSODRAFT_286180 [Phytophthora sojae]